MKRVSRIGTALLTAGVTVSSIAAEISGKVTLKGTPPPEIKIQFDTLCAKLHTNEVFTQRYLVAPDGGLANVFVYLKDGPPGKTYAVPDKTPLLDQIDCIFVPYMMGVMTNQKFMIRNSDPLMHNVHATPKAKGNKEFNIGQPVPGMQMERSFPAREVLIRISCDVHPWMFAYVGVMDHPYFAVTDKDGKFRLPAHLPAGRYTVMAHHVKAGEASQEVTVAEGDRKEVHFTLEAKARP